MKKLIPKDLSFIYEKIRKTIGTDPYIRVDTLHKENKNWYVDLICDKYDRAVGLSCIIRKRFEIYNEYVIIRVFFKNKETVVKCEGDYNRINNSRLALILIQLALGSNPYFCKASILTDKEDEPFKKIVVEFRPSVIQIRNENNKDFYGNSNIIARDIFQQILKDSMFKSVRFIYTNKSIIKQ